MRLLSPMLRLVLLHLVSAVVSAPTYTCCSCRHSCKLVAALVAPATSHGPNKNSRRPRPPASPAAVLQVTPRLRIGHTSATSLSLVVILTDCFTLGHVLQPHVLVPPVSINNGPAQTLRQQAALPLSYSPTHPTPHRRQAQLGELDTADRRLQGPRRVA